MLRAPSTWAPGWCHKMTDVVHHTCTSLPLYRREVDHVVTTKQLGAWLQREGIDYPKLGKWSGLFCKTFLASEVCAAQCAPALGGGSFPDGSGTAL